MLIKRFIRLFVILILILLTNCQTRSPFFYDFETEASLDALYWRCKTIYTLSDQNVTSGRKCLKLEVYPSSNPCLGLSNFHPDWSGYDTLRFDIYNQEDIPLQLTIRIDDTKDIPSYNNRYNNTVTLYQGANHVSIPLNSLITSDAKRKLNLSRIERVLLYLEQSREKRTLYLDNLRLE